MVEIRTYDGDGSDLAELCLRIRIQEGVEDKWAPLWDAAYVRNQIEKPAADRELMVAAYDGKRLVGSFFAVPYPFILHGQQRRGTFSTCLMIDPSYRALTPYVIEKLNRRHRDNNYAFSLGFIMGGPKSGPHQCWTTYARAYPRNCRFISEVGYWLSTFDPSVLDEASRFEHARVSGQLAGQLQGRKRIPEPGTEIRAYRNSDLDACLDCLNAQTAGADWAIHWNNENLGVHLQGDGNTRTMVAERAGGISGFISYHRLSLWNRETVRTVVFDLLATETGDDQTRRQLLSAACAKAREDGAQIATALRSSMFRARAMIPAGFLPSPDTGRLVVLFATENLDVSPSEEFAIMLR